MKHFQSLSKIGIFALALVAIFLIHNTAKAESIANQSSANTQSGFAVNTWYIIFNKTPTTATTTIKRLTVSLQGYTGPSTSTFDMDLGYFTCADYSNNQGAFPGLTSIVSNVIAPQAVNYTTGTIRFQSFSTETGWVLPNGKCIGAAISTTGASAATYINGTVATDNGYAFGFYGESYVFNSSGPPWESYVKDAFYQICTDNDCVSGTNNPNNTLTQSCEFDSDLAWSEASINYIGCVLFVPTTGLSYMTDAFASFQTVFPFSVFFETISTVQTIATDYASGGGQTLALTVGFPGADLIYTTSSVDLLTPTTLADHGFGTTVLEWWYNIILMASLVVMAWAVFTSIYHPN